MRNFGFAVVLRSSGVHCLLKSLWTIILQVVLNSLISIALMFMLNWSQVISFCYPVAGSASHILIGRPFAISAYRPGNLDIFVLDVAFHYR